jgi:hypothetical protein
MLSFFLHTLQRDRVLVAIKGVMAKLRNCFYFLENSKPDVNAYLILSPNPLVYILPLT